MASMRKEFHLEQYPEKVIHKVVQLKARYETKNMSNQEIAEAVNITPEDVDTILSNTCMVWAH